MDLDVNLKAKIWDFVAQFVCWEFCRNVQNLFPRHADNTEIDLLDFFRDMVIQRTTKQHESDISKFEAVAKFIEELNIATKYEQLVAAVQFSETLKRICPELQETTDDLITRLEEKYKNCVKGAADMIKDEEFYSLINTFSLESCKLLPVPELVELCGNWQGQNMQAEVVVTRNTVLNRMQQELAPEDIPEILDLIESGDVYQSCFKDDLDEDGSISISSHDLTEFQQECDNLVQGHNSSMSRSESSEDDDDCDQESTTAPAGRKYSLFGYNYSLVKTRKCSVVLEDMVRKYSLKTPYYASYIESLPKCPRVILQSRRISESDDDFMGTGTLEPRRASIDSEKKYPTGRRRKRKFICSSCGKSYHIARTFKSHKCKFISHLRDDDELSSGSCWSEGKETS